MIVLFGQIFGQVDSLPDHVSKPIEEARNFIVDCLDSDLDPVREAHLALQHNYAVLYATLADHDMFS
jgi:hypothetical protein